MSNIPSDLLYAKNHEWLREGADGIATVGISDYAQAQLGDLVFVELPEVDQPIAQAAECGVIESVKAASDLYSPVAGTITEVNETLSDAPDLVNQDPYGEGWIYKIRVDGEITHLLNASDYADVVNAESE